MHASPRGDVPDRDTLTRSETEILAMAYVLARAFGTLKTGGALERWGRARAGERLDGLGRLLAAVLRGDGPGAAAAVGGLGFTDPAAAAQARRYAAQLLGLRPVPR